MPASHAPLGAVPSPVRFHLRETDSTNSEALRRAQAGAEGPFWVTADRQIEGRGRRGRDWVSESGNLFATLVWPAAELPPETGRIPLVAALCAHRTVSAFIGDTAAVAIKWPNDILCGGGKVCGILAEQHRLADSSLIVIGIGINVASSPAIAQYPTACLADHIGAVEVDAVWARLAQDFEDGIALWSKPGGFAEIRRQWLERAAGIGERVTIRGHGPSRTGRFVTLSEDGYLVLQRNDGCTDMIASGDVSFEPDGS
ncbi:MAG: biotin--[acetyl-CoA-carboxylase] ligase [Pseudomonadota bacterium]